MKKLSKKLVSIVLIVALLMTVGVASAMTASATDDVAVKNLVSDHPSTEGSVSAHYCGCINGMAYQQDGIVSYNGYQYIGYWDINGYLTLARRTFNESTLVFGSWEEITFDYMISGYKADQQDSHNTVSIGLSKGDGVLHMSFDTHDNDINYIMSKQGFLNGSCAFTTESFYDCYEKNYLGSYGTHWQRRETYPRFLSLDNGDMIYEFRQGASYTSCSYLYYYSSTTHSWKEMGGYVKGNIYEDFYGASSDSQDRCTYINGLDGYTLSNGTFRIYTTWCWRQKASNTSNHNLHSAYSDDYGYTWYATGADGKTTTKVADLKNGDAINFWDDGDFDATLAFTIPQNYGLMNQTSQYVDDNGILHHINNHRESTDTTATKYLWHYWRTTDGVWHRQKLQDKDTGTYASVVYWGRYPVVSYNGCIYVAMNHLRIWKGTPSTGSGGSVTAYKWEEIYNDPNGWMTGDSNSQSYGQDKCECEPLIDKNAIKKGMLSIMYLGRDEGLYTLDINLNKLSGDIAVSDVVIDKSNAATAKTPASGLAPDNIVIKGTNECERLYTFRDWTTASVSSGAGGKGGLSITGGDFDHAKDRAHLYGGTSATINSWTISTAAYDGWLFEVENSGTAAVTMSVEIGGKSLGSKSIPVGTSTVKFAFTSASGNYFNAAADGSPNAYFRFNSSSTLNVYCSDVYGYTGDGSVVFPSTTTTSKATSSTTTKSGVTTSTTKATASSADGSVNGYDRVSVLQPVNKWNGSPSNGSQTVSTDSITFKSSGIGVKEYNLNSYYVKNLTLDTTDIVGLQFDVTLDSFTGTTSGGNTMLYIGGNNTGAGGYRGAPVDITVGETKTVTVLLSQFESSGNVVGLSAANLTKYDPFVIGLRYYIDGTSATMDSATFTIGNVYTVKVAEESSSTSSASTTVKPTASTVTVPSTSTTTTSTTASSGSETTGTIFRDWGLSTTSNLINGSWGKGNKSIGDDGLTVTYDTAITDRIAGTWSNNYTNISTLKFTVTKNEGNEANSIKFAVGSKEPVYSLTDTVTTITIDVSSLTGSGDFNIEQITGGAVNVTISDIYAYSGTATEETTTTTTKATTATTTTTTTASGSSTVAGKPFVKSWGGANGNVTRTGLADNYSKATSTTTQKEYILYAWSGTRDTSVATDEVIGLTFELTVDKNDSGTALEAYIGGSNTKYNGWCGTTVTLAETGTTKTYTVYLSDFTGGGASRPLTGTDLAKYNDFFEVSVRPVGNTGTVTDGLEYTVSPVYVVTNATEETTTTTTKATTTTTTTASSGSETTGTIFRDWGLSTTSSLINGSWGKGNKSIGDDGLTVTYDTAITDRIAGTWSNNYTNISTLKFTVTKNEGNEANAIRIDVGGTATTYSLTDTVTTITIDVSNLTGSGDFNIEQITGGAVNVTISDIYAYSGTATEEPEYTVTIDGVGFEAGSEYTLPVSTANGFIAYTDGTNYYTESQKLTLTKNITLTTVAIGTLTMKEGVSIRLGELSGMRFYTVATPSLLDNLPSGAVVQKGTLITRSDKIGNSELTLDATFQFANVLYDASDYFENENTFVGSIIGIRENNIAKPFIGRGYVTVTLGDVTKTIYADYYDGKIENNTRDVATVAYNYKNDAKSDYSGLSDSLKAIVDNWASKYVVPVAGIDLSKAVAYGGATATMVDGELKITTSVIQNAGVAITDYVKLSVDGLEEGIIKGYRNSLSQWNSDYGTHVGVEIDGKIYWNNNYTDTTVFNSATEVEYSLINKTFYEIDMSTGYTSGGASVSSKKITSADLGNITAVYFNNRRPAANIEVLITDIK